MDSDDGASASHAIVPWQARLAWVTIGLAATVGMADSAANVAFPSIANEFGIAPGDIQWVITLYILAQTSLAIGFGKIADRQGYTPVLRAGLLISAIALTGCAMATQYHVLVAMRILQGIGVGIILAVTPAMAASLRPAQEQRQAMAAYATWLAVGLAAGPLVGGHLVALGQWPAVFWARVPIALLALALTLLLPGKLARPAPAGSLPDRHASGNNPLAPDWLGATWLVASLGSLVLLLVQWRTPLLGIASIPVFALLLGACILCFVRAERSATDPVLPLHLFANPGFRLLQLCAVAVNVAAFSLFLLIPFLLSDWAAMPIVRAGYILTLYPLGMMISGLAGGWLGNRVSNFRLLVSGIAVCAAGLLVAAIASTLTSTPLLCMALLATGLGHGAFQVAYLERTLSDMPVSQRGVAGAITGVTRLLGIILATTILFSVHEAAENIASHVSFIRTPFAVSFLVSALVGALAFAVSLRLRRDHLVE